MHDSAYYDQRSIFCQINAYAFYGPWDLCLWDCVLCSVTGNLMGCTLGMECPFFSLPGSALLVLSSFCSSSVTGNLYTVIGNVFSLVWRDRHSRYWSTVCSARLRWQEIWMLASWCTYKSAVGLHYSSVVGSDRLFWSTGCRYLDRSGSPLGRCHLFCSAGSQFSFPAVIVHSCTALFSKSAGDMRSCFYDCIFFIPQLPS